MLYPGNDASLTPLTPTKLAAKIRASEAAHETLLRSVILIQSTARGSIALKAFNATKKAAYKAQAVVRPCN